MLEIEYLYTVSALAWKPDGTRIVAVCLAFLIVYNSFS